MSAVEAIPTMEEINDILRRKLSWQPLSSAQASLTLSSEQLEQLVRALGWHPTPTAQECVDDAGEFCCPSCGAHRIDHVAEGPCDLRDVNGFASPGMVEITYTMRACGSDGDWWLQCRHCLFEFCLPRTLDVEWN